LSIQGQDFPPLLPRIAEVCQEQRGDVGDHRCSASPKTIAWKVEKHAPASCQAFADSPAFRELKTTTGSPIRMNVMVGLLSVPDAGIV
jgi:hypothetical protein